MGEQRSLTALHVGGTSLSAAERQPLLSLYADYEHLTARAVEVFGSEIGAARWLSTESPDFAGRTPLQDLVLQGSNHAINVLGKIEHGIFF